MMFNGYVPLRRGILMHIHGGNLSTNEFATLVCLIMLADKDSGKGEINAPLLRYYLPDLSSDAAQRALSRLETKGYIYRHNPASSKRAYRYWVNNYEVTTGRYKARRVCLDEIAGSKDVKDILYVDSSTQGATVPATQGAINPANSNNNGNDKQKKREVAAVIRSDSMSSIPAGANGHEPLIPSTARTGEPHCGISPEAPGTGHGKQSKLIALSAIVKSKVNIAQSIGLDGTTIQDISNALDWALQEPFWAQRVVGAGALKSLLRNLPTIQRQMAAKRKVTTKTGQPQLKAASVAANPGKRFMYAGEVI